MKPKQKTPMPNTPAATTKASSAKQEIDAKSSSNESMTDNEALQLDTDVGLPKTTICQMIQEKLPEDVKMATQAKDLLIGLSTMFVANLAAKANTLCATHKKKTIVAEHVFEALYEQKQSHLLGPVLNQANYSKFSFVKQRDLALAKVNETEMQLKKTKSSGDPNMTQEQLQAEQEKIFAEARNYQMAQEMNYQQEQIMQIDQVAEPAQTLNSIDRIRDTIYQTDFETLHPSDADVLFEF